MAADRLSLHRSLVSREMLTELAGAQKSLRCVQMRVVKLPILGIGDLFARELEVRWKSLNMPGPSLPLGVSSSPNSITNHGTEDHKQHPSPSAQSHPLPCAETQLPEGNPYARAGETSESALKRPRQSEPAAAAAMPASSDVPGPTAAPEAGQETVPVPDTLLEVAETVAPRFPYPHAETQPMQADKWRQNNPAMRFVFASDITVGALKLILQGEGICTTGTKAELARRAIGCGKAELLPGFLEFFTQFEVLNTGC